MEKLFMCFLVHWLSGPNELHLQKSNGWKHAICGALAQVTRISLAEIEEALQRVCNEEALKQGAARAAETLRPSH